VNPLIATPRVRAVVVNRDGGGVVTRCMAALAATDWPEQALEVVLVDNASTDGSPDAVAETFPRVQVVRLEKNRGFAGGNNAALRDLGSIDHVALVNNDAFVDPGWLRPLVGRLEGDTGLGAACPKILLDGTFAELELESPVHVRGRGDSREVGVRVFGVRVDGNEIPGVYFARGFHGPERERGLPFQWTGGRARLLVPLRQVESQVELRLGSDRPKTVIVRSGRNELAIRTDRIPDWHAAPADALDAPIINSAGVLVDRRGYGADRGFLEVDRGQCDTPADVPAWSGAAVLLRRRYLEDVGLFDERLFLYYEDFDLSWRGRSRGWRYDVVPASIVRHAHASSTSTGSALFDHYNERNRLIAFTKNAPGPLARSALFDSLYATALHAKRDVVARALAGEQPDLLFLGRRLRATAAYALALPHAAAERRRERRASLIRFGA
jgi:GT2 family glycosyltransferase